MRYSSRITIVYDGNDIEADNVEDYLEKLKDGFHQDFGIDLDRDEIMIYGDDDK